MGLLSKQTLANALVVAYLHDLAALKAACVEFIRTNSFAVTMSKSYKKLEKAHPAIWRQLRVALGLPEEDDDDDSEEEEEEKEEDGKEREEGPQRKSARREV